MSDFGVGSGDLLLDPFCGTGTTLVEAKKTRIPSVGCDAHPLAALATRVKTNWSVEEGLLRQVFKRILKSAGEAAQTHGSESRGGRTFGFG